jgi:ribonuclease Z
VSTCELIVLGTSAQVPTRHRAQHGAVLRWDDEVVLLDPDEGAQRQLTLAGVAPSTITRICLTHLHGDHCLGLPGVLQRLVLDGVRRPVDLYYPSSGQEYVDRLRRASAAHRPAEVREHPVTGPGVVDDAGGFTLYAGALEHRIETYGWRVQEPDGRRMMPEQLARRGIGGPDVGRLQRDGMLETGRGIVRLEEVSVLRPGQSFAFVMDTRRCAAAVELARGVDLLVCESTYLSAEADLAAAYTHLTAADAGRIAAEAGALRLVLTHFSQRHRDESAFAAEAAQHFPDVDAARDLDRFAVPGRVSS